MDRAIDYGMHSFAAFLNSRDEIRWRCQGCYAVVGDFELQSGQWPAHAGASCPSFLMLLPAAQRA